MGWQHDPDRGRSGLTDRGYNGPSKIRNLSNGDPCVTHEKVYCHDCYVTRLIPSREYGIYKPDQDKLDIPPVADHKDNPEDDFINDGI